jgi:phosphomannomutase
MEQIGSSNAKSLLTGRTTRVTEYCVFMANVSSFLTRVLSKAFLKVVITLLAGVGKSVVSQVFKRYRVSLLTDNSKP